MVLFDVDQAGWGSRLEYADGTKLPWAADKWVVHWGGGATPTAPGVDAEMATLRAWQRYHIDTKGWQDIAYNYAIGNSGTVYRLRGENRNGATAGDFEPDGIPENHEARAVVFIINVGQAPSAAALDAFSALWAADPIPVIGHKWVFEEGTGGTATACPGPVLDLWLRSEGFKMAEHSHVPMPNELPREWADQMWAAYVEAGGSSVPESRTWTAYREDLAWIHHKFMVPMQAALDASEAAVADLELTVEQLTERVAVLEASPAVDAYTKGESDAQLSLKADLNHPHQIEGHTI